MNESDYENDRDSQSSASHQPLRDPTSQDKVRGPDPISSLMMKHAFLHLWIWRQ